MVIVVGLIAFFILIYIRSNNKDTYTAELEIKLFKLVYYKMQNKEKCLKDYEKSIRHDSKQ